MKVNLDEYRSLVFDCDGVVLNSNKVKTQAFYQAALPYGQDAAQRLVDFHVNNGGISRYKKFALFLDTMVEGLEGPGLEELLDSYAGHVRAGLMDCEVSQGLDTLREATPHARWLIVSGGDQNELRDVFSDRGIDKNFDGGIYGSPDTKDEILSRELTSATIATPALFLGDSTYDHKASTGAGLDFVFIYGWTEVPGWKDFCHRNGLTTASDLNSLI